MQGLKSLAHARRDPLFREIHVFFEMNFEIGTGLKRLSTPDVKTTRPSE